jgi:hypothetical protein
MYNVSKATLKSTARCQSSVVLTVKTHRHSKQDNEAVVDKELRNPISNPAQNFSDFVTADGKL